MKCNCKSNIVESLRKNGYSVRITHYRDYNLVRVYDEKSEEYIVVDDIYNIDLDLLEEATGKNVADMTGVAQHQLPKSLHKYVTTHGGVTTAEITAPDGTEVFGKAECSVSDNFNRRLGVKLALKRALQQLKNEHICS